MKNSKRLLMIMVIAAFGIVVSSCVNNKNENSTQKVKKEEHAEKLGKEYTSAYICPMHCKGSGSDKLGKCPVCEMDYVKNKKNKSNEHNHDHNGGHDHDNHEGHNH